MTGKHVDVALHARCRKLRDGLHHTGTLTVLNPDQNGQPVESSRFRTATAIVIAFDPQDKVAFDRVKKEIYSEVFQWTKGKSPIFLVAEQPEGRSSTTVSFDEVSAFAASIGAQFSNDSSHSALKRICVKAFHAALLARQRALQQPQKAPPPAAGGGKKGGFSVIKSPAVRL